MSCRRITVGWAVLPVAACVLAGAACGGTATVPGSARGSARAAAMGTRSPVAASPTAAASTPARPVALPAPWPERRLLPESVFTPGQAFDLATDVLYALVLQNPARAGGPYTLQATDLRTGVVRRGESYPLTGLSLVSGYLWVHGWPSAGTPPVLLQVGVGTLRTVRSVSLSRVSWASGVAPGPAGSVWVGAYRTLLRMSVSTGAVLARAVLPAGLGLSDMAADPDGAYLYVSAAHVVAGPAMYGAVLLEYSARTGHLLAETDRTPISYSVAGAELTAVPGGVWVSFRTGSLGRSVLLSERSLATIIAPGSDGSPGSVYYWPMSSSSVYGAGALWVTTQTGLVACVNPATGQVRASELVTSQAAQLSGLLAADGAARQVFGLVANDGYGGLVSLSPPRSCWG
jgi:hypothetical protein